MSKPAPPLSLGPAALATLTFISTCEVEISARPVAIAALVQHAERANRLNGITGALLLTPDHFVHTLEGTDEALDALMARISFDPRHAEIVIVDRRPVAERTFAQWSLVYSGPSVFIRRLTLRAKQGDVDDTLRLLQLLREFGR